MVVFKKKRLIKNVIQGIAHIYATFHNTIITITDQFGSVLSWSSCGSMGFKGTKGGSAFAAQMAAEDACRKAKSCGLKVLEIRIKGTGAGRETALRTVSTLGFKILLIKDVTPIPHNGCRPSKKRRM